MKGDESPPATELRFKRVRTLLMLVLSLFGLVLLLQPTALGRKQEPDYSTFKHSSDRHAQLECAACHKRTADNSVTPAFPSHPSCTNCHLAQFVNPAGSICIICHTDLSSGAAPLRGFPANFKENFNVKFDHSQHTIGSARPANGCAGCHDRTLNRGAAMSIPAKMTAHSQCYTCHTPTSRASSGQEINSCGVCHTQTAYSRTSTNARSYRLSFSHSKHGPRQRLECTSCHTLTAGLPQGKQVRSPQGLEHFPTRGGQSCATCHNGKRSFGGDLAFGDCRRCHTGASFRM
jgi:c(7)-type cytochrome triheme protein